MTIVLPIALAVMLGIFGMIMVAQGIDTLKGLAANKKQSAEMNRNAVLTYRKIYGYGVEVPIVHAHTGGHIFLGVMFLLSGLIGFVLAGMMLVATF